MLVLTRKMDESIRIGDEIVVRVVKLSGGRVRLAIDAPSDIRISRGELIEDAPVAISAELSTDCAKSHCTVS